MKSLIRYFVLILISATLFGCSAATPPEQSPPSTNTSIKPTLTPTRPTPAHTLAPTTTSILEPLPTPVPNDLGLTIEENEIAGEISLEPLTFTPVHGSQEAILARHADEKEEAQRISYSIMMDDGQNLQAFIESTTDEKIKVILKLNDESIFEVDAGDSSALYPFHGLWVEDGSWVLEIAYVTTTLDDNLLYSESIGQVYRDGVNLNQQSGYEEIFGYQLLGGKPFFFYKLDGEIHLSYDGEELPVWYDDVRHHRCCSAGVLNPTQAANWVGFWGTRDGVWYYTEIGRY